MVLLYYIAGFVLVLLASQLFTYLKNKYMNAYTKDIHEETDHTIAAPSSDISENTSQKPVEIISKNEPDAEETFQYHIEDGALIIKDSVTEIPANAFRNFKDIVSVNIPDSVTTLGKNAFTNCSHLTAVTLGRGITIIEEGTFSECIRLRSVIINGSIRIVGKEAFKKCALTTIFIPNSVTTIGHCAFEGCTSLTSANIPNNVEFIGINAFKGSSLTSVAIPDSTYMIGSSAFSGTNLKTICAPRGFNRTMAGVPKTTRVIIRNHFVIPRLLEVSNPVTYSSMYRNDEDIISHNLTHFLCLVFHRINTIAADPAIDPDEKLPAIPAEVFNIVLSFYSFPNNDQEETKALFESLEDFETLSLMPKSE